MTLSDRKKNAIEIMSAWPEFDEFLTLANVEELRYALVFLTEKKPLQTDGGRAWRVADRLQFLRERGAY